MGRKIKDLTGKIFGRLTVIKRVDDYVFPSGYKAPQWLCNCDCGNEVVVIGKSLTRENGTKSCGCWQKENMSKIKKKYNTYDLSSNFGIGYTFKGEEFYFDLDDYDKIKDHCWHIDKAGYVVCSTPSTIKMHRIIMNCDKDLMVDHIHGKETRRDNRKSNLRIATHGQNMINRRLTNNKSGTTGVFFYEKLNKWAAYININKQRIYLGSFDTFDEARLVREKAEKEYFGEFAYDYSQQLGVQI